MALTAPGVSPSYSAILSGQKYLAPHARQSNILLFFKKPFPYRNELTEFYRVRLARDMLAERSGESSFYEPWRTQPDRVADAECRKCRRPMVRENAASSVCMNPKCELFHVYIDKTPVRGIVGVSILRPESICEREPFDSPLWGPIIRERVCECLLTLDRRYSDGVLQGIYRTCGMLCELQGWKLRSV